MNSLGKSKGILCMTRPGEEPIPISDLVIDTDLNFPLSKDKEEDYSCIKKESAYSGSFTIKVENQKAFDNFMKSIFPEHYCLICGEPINKTTKNDLKNNKCFKHSLHEKYQQSNELKDVIK